MNIALSMITPVAALITAIAAIIAPLITVKLNNDKELKIKRMELGVQQKISAYKDFCDKYGNILPRTRDGISQSNRNDIKDFASAANIAAINCDNKETRAVIYKTSKAVIDRWSKDDSIDELFQECVTRLAEEINHYSRD